MRFANPRRSSQRPLWSVVVLAAVLLGAACTSGGDPQSPSSPTPGRTVTSSSEFDTQPCAVASVEEMREALNEPFNVIAGNLLEPEGPPTVIGAGATGPGGAAGCEYHLLGEGTTESDAYHLVVVKVVRLASGGPELLAACEDVAEADPLMYRVLDLADGACAGQGAVMTVLVGSTYYTVTASAVPGPADQSAADLELGRLCEAAGTLVAPRLPAT